ncbi:MAG: hypothetical protein HYR56_32120 [Acidobacteria bacterium]|nr:hypothetical protein [Acidobacteriota bacterium]MBI3427584.1 hypothetical protein [Acidobacteriota bacterium]
MQVVQADFDARAKEVDEYFDFVKAILSADSELAYTDNFGVVCAYKVSSDLQKTLKATGFLLVYNLVESTMKNALEAIILHLLAHRVGFDDLSSKVKVVVLKNAKACSPEKLEPHLSQIGLDIIEHTFRKEELFSGNLDAREIRETMQTYGIIRKHGVNGDCLLTIKAQRNALAHGTVSFTECGRDYDIVELTKYKDDAKAYLQATLNDIEHFLANDDFRK